MRTNNGAPGIDRTTLDWIEKEYGINRLLDELSSELRDGAYRPLPARRVYIPKPETTDKRPLSIPAVRDRIVQAALKIVLEPIFEADFAPCSFGFRPKRGQHDALQVLVDETWRGRRWVVETECAGINRLGGGDGKALRRRSSDPRRPRVMRRCSRGCRRSVDRGTCRPGY